MTTSCLSGDHGKKKVLDLYNSYMWSNSPIGIAQMTSCIGYLSDRAFKISSAKKDTFIARNYILSRR